MKETRKLTVTGRGTTYYITIPQKIIKVLKWRKGQKLNISLNNQKVVIEDWEKDNGE